MPRTKVSKNSKRNREAAHREEKVRDFESTLDAYQTALETHVNELINELNNEWTLLKQRTNSKLLQLRMKDFVSLDIKRFIDWQPNDLTLDDAGNKQQTNLLCSTKVPNPNPSNPNDEGYLTEDSALGGGSTRTSSHSTTTTTISAFTPSALLPRPTFSQQSVRQGQGPLLSHKARRTRRSRSAGGLVVAPGSSIKPKPSAARGSGLANSGDAHGGFIHPSRSKMRTPITSRQKAISADRVSRLDAALSNVDPQSPPVALMRYPRPGEMVVSACGTPVVSQTMPERFANVNIPVRNGILSLRPKKLDELNSEFFEVIDAETLEQIKTLHQNLNMIVRMADKAGVTAKLQK